LRAWDGEDLSRTLQHEPQVDDRSGCYALPLVKWTRVRGGEKVAIRAIHEDESADRVSFGVNCQLVRWRNPFAGASKRDREKSRDFIALLPNFKQRRIRVSTVLLWHAPAEKGACTEEQCHWKPWSSVHFFLREATQ
jgi:hypothetical protein